VISKQPTAVPGETLLVMEEVAVPKIWGSRAGIPKH